VLEGSISAIDDWLSRHAPLRHQAMSGTTTDARLDVRLASAGAEAVAHASITASEGDSPDGHEIENIADDRPDTYWEIEDGEGAGFIVSLDAETVLNALRLTSFAGGEHREFDPETFEVYASST